MENKLSRDQIDKILDRRSDYIERLEKPDVPSDLRDMMNEYFLKTQDKVTGLQPRWALDEALDNLRKKDVSHAVAAIDFRNLGGLNTELNHEKTNEILREVAKDYLQKNVRELGGEVYRSGGDEFHAVVPHINAIDLTLKMKYIQEEIQKNVVIKRDIDFIPHKTQNGIPAGAGNIDFGCADSLNYNSTSDLLIAADKVCYDNKREYLESIKQREIEFGRLWEYDSKDMKYHLLIDLSKEKKYESKFTRSETERTRHNGFHSSRIDEIRIGDRGSIVNRGSESSNRDKRGVREEERDISERKQGIDSKPEIAVKELVAYAEERKFKVPEKTQERWQKLLEGGESDINIRSYIDNCSINIKGPEIDRTDKIQEKLKNNDKEIGMDL